MVEDTPMRDLDPMIQWWESLGKWNGQTTEIMWEISDPVSLWPINIWKCYGIGTCTITILSGLMGYKTSNIYNGYMNTWAIKKTSWLVIAWEFYCLGYWGLWPYPILGTCINQSNETELAQARMSNQNSKAHHRWAMAAIRVDLCQVLRGAFGSEASTPDVISCCIYPHYPQYLVVFAQNDG